MARNRQDVTKLETVLRNAPALQHAWRRRGDAHGGGDPRRAGSVQLGLFSLSPDINGVSSALGPAVRFARPPACVSRGIGQFLVGSTLAGVSQSMLQLVLFRAVQGLGAGA